MSAPTSQEYAGFALAMGEVYGLRTWRMDDHGRLRAMHLEMAPPWRPGVNEAVCYADSYGSVGFMGGFIGGLVTGGMVLGPPSASCQCTVCTAACSPQPEQKLEQHAVPDESCACGFYAYTSPKTRETYSGHDGNVFGVIRGTGRTLIGTKGFRSEKAEIVALLDPSHGRDGTYGEWMADRLRSVYPEVPLLPRRADVVTFAPLESPLPQPDSDEFWSLP